MLVGFGSMGLMLRRSRRRGFKAPLPSA
nr:hypothetical protein [Sphingomonas arenae]